MNKYKTIMNGFMPLIGSSSQIETDYSTR